MPAYFRRPHLRPRILLSHSRSFARDELRNPFASFEFPVVIPRGSHPFPSRTRKLSLAGPMILHGQLCGNVGRRRDNLERPRSEDRGLFFAAGLFQGGAVDFKLGCGNLADDEFIAAFEECRLSPGGFHHADHIRLAWLYVRRFGAAQAEQRLLAGIQKMALHAGAPQKFLYTTTVAWARLVA